MKIKEVALPDHIGKAYIIDDVFGYDNIRSIYNEATALPFTFSQKSEQHSTIPNTRLAYHVEPGTELSNLLADTADKLLRKVRKKQSKKDKIGGLQISEIYVNTADALSTMLPHTDRPKGCWTLLYYANYEWDIKWGGQTNFIDGNSMEILASVIPKPGRFVLFEANILHQATPPTFYAPFRRFTIPFKMDPLTDEMPYQEVDQEGKNYVTTNSCRN